MTTDETPDWSLTDFAKQLAGIHRTAPAFDFTEETPEASDPVPEPAREDDTKTPPLVSNEPDALPADLQSTHAHQVIAPFTARRKQLKTSDELATTLMAGLRSIDNFPERGLVVTVYGSNPWNAMLTIRPDAGRGIDRDLWASRVQDIAVMLREKFDIKQEAETSTNEFLSGATGRHEEESM